MDKPEVMERIERAIARIERATRELGTLEAKMRHLLKAQEVREAYPGA